MSFFVLMDKPRFIGVFNLRKWTYKRQNANTTATHKLGRGQRHDDPFDVIMTLVGACIARPQKNETDDRW